MTAATTPLERWRLGYRPALDGVRGLAILLVILHHAGVGGIRQSGYLGVTLFFGLSGFLISTLLEEERHRTGSVNLRAFYRRRALRLFPALVAFTVIVAGWLALTGRTDQILAGAGPTLLYVANIFRAGGTEMGLFDHTWSLAIEEQFYLLWPIAYVGALWRSRRLAIGVLIASAVASAAWRLALLDRDDLYRVAFAPDTRADAILLGCALALVATSPRGLPRIPGGVTLPLFAVAVGASMVLSWRDVLLALPLLALASIALVARAAGAERSILTWPPLVRLGAISYGLYLWHLPIVVDGAAILDLPAGLEPLVLIAVSLAFAAASYRWIETPFLRLRHAGGVFEPKPSP